MLTFHRSPDFPPFSTDNITPAKRRGVLLRQIDLVLDVGANEGQYARWLRSLGYDGRIISFEPVPKTFQALTESASSDARWECHNLALGPTDAETEIHVARNSISSSVFEPTETHLLLDPDAAEVERVHVPMRTLASLWPDLDCDGARIYLKIDVEGYELAVLSGGLLVLDAVSMIELEISLAPTYTGAPLLDEILAFVTENGFSALALEQNHEDDETTGQMMMIDGIFTRRPSH
jgi:FkbM family methyltransferase